MRARPAPKPSAMKCAGCPNAKPAVGRAMITARSSREMVEAGLDPHRLAIAIHHRKMRIALLDGADTRERQTELLGKRRKRFALSLVRGEGEFVIVAAG